MQDMPVIKGYKLVPVREFAWDNDFSYHRTMTCRNHPTARYLTKNAFQRSIFVSVKPVADGTPRTELGDCTCELGDLLVMVQDDSAMNAGKDVIINKCADKGIAITRAEVVAVCGGDGGYMIDGMAWNEWLDAMTMD